MPIKREPLRRAAASESPCSGRQRAKPATAISSITNLYSVTENRDMHRSAAPSVDSGRMFPPQIPASEAAEGGDDDEVLIMEVKPRPRIIKPDPDPRPPEVDSLEAPTHRQDSILDRNFQRIASNVRALGETLGELQSLGIQHVASLPSLVLVGDQSSGKSTLMSGIAGLSLPHREGMCTRCPVHIRLSKSDTWRLEISLQQDFSLSHGPRQPGPANRFGPWHPQPRVTKEFWSTKRKDDEIIKSAIRWAQVAILNHNISYERFKPRYGAQNEYFDLVHEESRLDEAERDATATIFSPNTVALNISGPNLPDLSFYDLPGIIKTPKHERDAYLVKMVENLAKKYISDKHALILWAVPMNADAENSSTLAVIRSQNAQDRTVGIMTKADLLPQSSRASAYAQWLAMLQGHQHKVGQGFFITARQPLLDADQSIDLYKQNSFEESFFNRQRPASNYTESANTAQSNDVEAGLWPREFDQYADRCGLNSLVVFLSKTLSRAFVNSLPDILQLVENRLEEVNAELRTLPDTPANPYAELRESLMNFTNSVKLLDVSGGQFEADWGELTEKFKDEVMGHKPRFVVAQPRQGPGPGPGTSQPGTPGAVINLVNNSDDAVSVVGDAPVPSSRRRNLHQFLDGQDAAAVSTTPKRPRYGAGSKTAKQEDELSQSGSIFRRLQTPRSRTLNEVRDRIKSRLRRGIPGITPPEVYEELGLEAISLWKAPLDDFITKFVQKLDDHIKALLARSFEKVRNRAAFRESEEHLDAFIQKQESALFDTVRKLYERESRRLYTTDAKTLDRHRADEDALIRRQRHYFRWKAYQNARGKDVAPLKPLESMTSDERGNEEKEMANQRKILGDDEYDTELRVCAYVRGYYLTAAHRFVDSVALAIVSDFTPHIVHEICGLTYLDTKLDLINGGQARIDALMAEDPGVANKRKKLLDEKNKLKQAMDSIMKLKASGDDQADMGPPASQTTQPASPGDNMGGSEMSEFPQQQPPPSFSVQSQRRPSVHPTVESSVTGFAIA